jgi:hypothetical protein
MEIHLRGQGHELGKLSLEQMDAGVTHWYNPTEDEFDAHMKKFEETCNR